MSIWLDLALLPVSVWALLWYMGWAARQGVTFPAMGGIPRGARPKDPELLKFWLGHESRWAKRGVVAALVAAVVVAPFAYLL